MIKGRRYFITNEIHIIEYDNGSKKWYFNGILHRENGPAIELANGDREWYRNGKRHRENGPAIQWSDGTRMWYQNGKHHRENGPAIEYGKYKNNKKEWWLNGTYYGSRKPENWDELVALKQIEWVMYE